MSEPRKYPPNERDRPSIHRANVARRSLRSSFVLVVGNLASKAILVVASLIIARLLGPSGYGIYSLALAVPIFITTFSGLGLSHAVQRYSSYYLSKGDVESARRMTLSAILLIVIVGSIMTLLTFFEASFFSSMMLHRPGLTFYVQLSSFLVIAQVLLQALTYTFIGWGSPASASGLSMLQSTLKLFLSPVLILVGFGILGAIGGHVISYAVPALVGIGALFFLKLRGNGAFTKINPEFQGNIIHNSIGFSTLRSFLSDVRQMLRFGIPLYIGNSFSQFSISSYILIILSIIVSNAVIGYYQAAFALAQGIVLISNAIGFSLFSAFSSLDGLGEDTRIPFKYAITYVSLVMTPVVLFVIVSSGPLIRLLYGSGFGPASILLSFLALSYLPGALGLTVMPQFFNGIGRSKLTMVMYLLLAILIFVLAPLFTLVLGLGVFGAIYAIIIGNSGSALFGSYLAKRYVRSTIDFQAVARIFFASDISFLAVYLSTGYLKLSAGKIILADLVIFFGIYLTLIPLFRVITEEDLERIRMSSLALGVVGRPLALVVRYETYLYHKTGGQKSPATQRKNHRD